MARIRSIKPEFWTSEQIVDCSPITRLLFIGMWNFCDDGGNHPASARTLKMEVFPGDDISIDQVQKCVDELIRNELIILYESEGKGYWHVTGWKHQKIDRPTYKYPKFDEHSAITRRDIDESSPPDVDVDVERNILSGKPDLIPSQNQEKEVLGHLNTKTGRNYRPVKANLSLITRRLKEGYSVDDMIRVIDDKCSAWLGDKKMQEYLRPKTLFNATNFSQYAAGTENTVNHKKPWEVL